MLRLLLASLLLATASSATTADRIEALLADGDAWHGELAAVYDARDHAPAWTGAAQAARMLARLADAPADGLRADEVHLPRLRRLARDTAAVAERDLLLTDAALRYADALLGRRVDPERLYSGHHFLTRAAKARRRTPAARELRTALASGSPARAVAALLDRLTPRHAEYRALRDELAALHAARLDLAAFAPAPPRTAGARGEIPPAPSPAFDADRAVRLALNLERWRWLPEELGAEHILVNVPSYGLWLREGAPGAYRTALAMDATVGAAAPEWQTPVLSDPIRSVSFHPTWTPTVNIQRREILPEARADGGQSLHERGFDVWRGRTRLDPRTVDWDRARAGQYRIVQRGGPLGALGRVKFVMPNRHFILLHDTNTPEEFEQDERALSHGCVRVAEPGVLADAVLGRANGWAEGRASGLVEGTPRTRGTRLRSSFPVHIVYMTAWPAAGGDGGPGPTVELLDDLYGRDAALAEALGLTLPAPG